MNKENAIEEMDKGKKATKRKEIQIALGLMLIITVGACLFLGPCAGCTSHPRPTVSRVVPCKEIVDDIRSLWSFERNYAYRHKFLASSISEMGEGTGIGKNGFVLVSSIWDARIDDDNANAVPVTYRINNPDTGLKESVGAYRFGIVPVLSSSGETENFAVILIAVPEIPADDDFCFVALCGPVNLQNDFSFDKEWPVFQLKATKEVVRKLRDIKAISIDKLMDRLTNGDLKPHVKREFNNLYYPKDEE